MEGLDDSDSDDGELLHPNLEDIFLLTEQLRMECKS
jgi:hypothetical protein